MNEFSEEYFKQYSDKNIFGLEKGERPFLYSFWMRNLRRVFPKGVKILEVGCGPGYFLKWLEKRYDVVGMDISLDALRFARNRVKVPLYVGSAQNLPFKNSSFSAIIGFDVIEHLEVPELFLSEVYKVLNSQGILILSTPNPESFGCKIKQKRWQDWRDSTHINIKMRKEWKRLLRDNGFRILRDGTDTLWDVPYFRKVPLALEKMIFLSVHWLLTWLFGFLPWNFGENYICIAQKVNK